MLKDIAELVNADVISQETADKIQDFYQKKGATSSNRLLIVFGILGAILVGLGVILLIAHNWDELSRTLKTGFAFLPLLFAQILCGFVLLKKQDNVAWKETGTAFLFFAVGASIALISQIYHIPGDLSAFVLTWMLLCLPLVYVMQSSIGSLLYLIGITYYATKTNYWTYPSIDSYLYWFLLLAIIPHYYLLSKKKPEGNFTVFHNWMIPLSLMISLGTIIKYQDELMVIAYFSLFGLFYLIGHLDFFEKQRLRNNGYKIIGSLGTMGLLLILSFDWYWEELRSHDFLFNEVIRSPEFIGASILTLLASGFLVGHLKNNLPSNFKPTSIVFLLFILTFIIGLSSPLPIIIINLLVFILGIFTIREGAKLDNLGILNYGLLIITFLVICRFFDTDLSFLITGGLFVAVGIGFFATNFWMLQKRKANV